MSTKLQYKTSQISSTLVQQALEQEQIEVKVIDEAIPNDITTAETAIKLPSLINSAFNTEGAYIITEEDKEYLYLKFTNISISKLGYNCSPNGIGQSIKLAQTFKSKSIYNNFIIRKTCTFEFQEEDIMRQVEEQLVETTMGIFVYAIKLPLSYLNKKSIIDFVLNYAWNTTTEG